MIERRKSIEIIRLRNRKEYKLQRIEKSPSDDLRKARDVNC